MFPYTTNQVWPAPPTQLYSYQTNQQPYQSINFLNQAFNYNKQSIAAYQTLPHEMKLQFYLSVQQMKLLGYMQNKTRYQSILQEIARRKMILKKPDQNIKVQNNNDWGVKLDNILDGHLKKLQRDNFLDDIPVAINTTHQVQQRQVDFLSGEVQGSGISGKKKTGQDDQQFEWAQSVDNSTAINSQAASKINQNVSGNKSQPYIQPISFDELIKKQNSIKTKPQNIEIEPKAQIIDVWDLQVIQDEPKNTKTPTQNPNNNTNYSTFPNNNYSNDDQFEFQPQIKADKFAQPIQDNNIFNKSTPVFNNTYQNNQHNNFNQYNTNNNTNINRQNKNNSINTNYNHNIHDNVQYNGQNISSLITNANTIQNQHPNGFTSLPNNNKNSQVKTKSIQNQQEQFQWQENTDNLATTQPQIAAVVNISQPVSTSNIYRTQDITTVINVSQPQPQQQQFDFTFLQPQTNNTNISYSSSNIIGSSPSYSTQNIAQKVPYESSVNFGLDVSSIDSTFTFPTNARQQQVFNQSSINNSYAGGFRRKNTGEYNINNQDQIQQTQQNLNESAIIAKIDTNILQPLKRFPSTKKILSMLNKKIFDFDRKFYQETLNLIAGLGYEKNADYQFVKQQGEICDEIFRLTELYTAAVDQDKQDELRTTLKQSKILYTKLDTKKTATLAKKYLKLDGRTLNYEIGRLSLQAGVPGFLIKKIVAETKFNEIVTVLYLTLYLGNIFSIGTFGCQIIEYMEHIMEQMQQIAYRASEMNPECLRMIKESQKFLQYRINISKIAEVAKRILQLAKICNKDQIHPKLPQIIQKITPLLPPDSQSQQYLIPTNFLTFFSNFACREINNIYTLHQKMNQFIQQNPLCTICLHPIQQKIGKQGQKNTDNKSYHYKCWNFRYSINRWKQEQIKKQNQQINQEKEQNEQKIEQKNTVQN